MNRLALLHAAGGHNIGIGHLSRTATLAKALKETGYWSEVALLWETTSPLAHHFFPPGCTLYQADSSQKVVDIRQHIPSRYDHAILFTDLLHLTSEDIAVAKQQGYQTVIHINDSGLGRFSADVIVNGDAFTSKNHLPVAFKGVALLGSKYRIIRSAVSDLRPSNPWQNDQVKKILVTLGGADPANLTIKFLEALSRHIQELDCLVTAVIGPAFDAKHASQIRAISTQIPHYQILESPDCLAKIILEHDLVITLGGITAYEAMCLGRPNAAIAWKDMQPYVEHLSASGLMATLGQIHQATHALSSIVRDLKLLKKVGELGWCTIDGKGAHRISMFIAQYIHSQDTLYP